MITITFEITEEQAAAIWQDLWGADCDLTTNARCQRVVMDRAAAFYKTFPRTDRRKLRDEFLNATATERSAS
jgi:hypothetical protein